MGVSRASTSTFLEARRSRILAPRFAGGLFSCHDPVAAADEWTTAEMAVTPWVG